MPLTWDPGPPYALVGHADGRRGRLRLVSRQVEERYFNGKFFLVISAGNVVTT